MSDSKFCTKCGATLNPGMNFCPECGAVVAGTEAESKINKEYQEYAKASATNFLMFALAVYALPALIAGILIAVDANSTAQALLGNSDFQHWMDSHHYDFSESQITNYLTIVGVMEIVSGACVVGCMYFINKGEKRVLATILCAIASCLCVWSIFGMLIGFIMTFNVYSAKELFKD